MSLRVAVTQDTRPMQPTQRFEGHIDWVRGVTQLRCGQRIMTCSDDGSLRVWNSQSGERIAKWQAGGGYMRAMSLSPDEKKVVSGSGNGAVRLWNIDTGKVIAEWTGHTQTVNSVCWNQGAERVVSGALDGTARVWDVKSGRTVLEIETGFRQVFAVIYSPDTTMIATGGLSTEEDIKIWDANTGKLVANLKGHTVRCLAWTADGRTLVSGSSDHSIRTWNTSTWQQVAVLTGHTNIVWGIAISPNGRILASAAWDRTARLWNLENGQPIGSPLQHSTEVNCVSFSTDGKLLATGCSDHNAYTWNISGIVGDAGLVTDGDKSLLNAVATRRPSQPHEHFRRLPPAFFNDTPQHPDVDPSIRRPISPPSSHHNTSPRPRFLHRTRHLFFHMPWRRNDEGIALRGNSPEVADVPLGTGKHMYYAASQLPERREKEKQNARRMKNAKNASAGRTVQQFSGAPQAQSSSESHAVLSAMSSISAVATTPTTTMHNSPGASKNYSSSGLHAAISTSSTAPAVSAATSAISLTDAIRLQAGCWTRFRLLIGCMPVQNTNGHH